MIERLPHEPPLRRMYGGRAEELFLERRTQAKQLRAELEPLREYMNAVDTLGHSLKVFRSRYKTRTGWKEFRNHARGEIRREIRKIETQGKSLASTFSSEHSPKRRLL